MSEHDDERDERPDGFEDERDAATAAIVRDAVPEIGTPLKGVSSSLVRDWVRSALVPAALTRLYEIGMGTTRFDVPTMAGNTVNVPAPAAVQRAALRDVIQIGVPQQLGLTDERDDAPGVLALGEWELAQARGEAHPPTQRTQRALPESVGERMVQDAADHVVADMKARGIADAIDKALDPAHGYTPPAGHEVVVVEEDGSKQAHDTRGEEPPPPVDPDRNALAKQFLERRRAARAGRISLNGSHPNIS